MYQLKCDRCGGCVMLYYADLKKRLKDSRKKGFSCDFGCGTLGSMEVVAIDWNK